MEFLTYKYNRNRLYSIIILLQKLLNRA